MKLGLLGFPQAGKKTLFRLLTGKEGNDAGKAKGDALGLAPVRDERFERLVEIYDPRLRTPAQLEFLLLPDLQDRAERNAELWRVLEKMDVICHVVRVFTDDSVFHVSGTVDPRRDIAALNEELQLNDLLFIEKRFERLEKEKGRNGNGRRVSEEKDLLSRMKEHLEAGKFLRNFPFTEEEQKLLSGYLFLTRKPMIVVLNVGEDQIRDGSIGEAMEEEYRDLGIQWVAVSAKIEEELSALDAEEREAFLRELNLSRPALDRLTLVCYEALGLISFFTVGKDEVRAWPNRRNSLAPQAARVIHSDIERGFIRAEVIKFDDLVRLGSEQKVREAGKLMKKGRDYVVQDGDIISFLFNV
ncbi:MAG TPA: redox-regulated ATPase YchF [Thermodesulfobacteriota bacterium]|nr:redox-regulated ATPase YchF [Thermodesulfobacteriota bacterium]